MRLAIPLAVALALVLPGCASDEDDGDAMGGMGMGMGPGSYHMGLDGMPMGEMAPGQMFNVSVSARNGMSGMHAMMSDHIGAHYWNRTMMDPTAGLGNATTCQHRAAEAPGEWTAQCTAPAQPGTYYLRSHMRMMDEDGQMHHWWSDERTFTVG